jgi:putative component of membrane protein insertase Oxa1/YidC/SpoIIIJ protein YidD
MIFRIAILFLCVTLTGHAVAGFYEPWGKDSDLRAPPPRQEEEKISLGTRIADAVIRFHQTVISPVDGPRSHYRPSSSQYMHLAMHRYGFVKGFIMGCDRLLRENDEEWVYRKIEVNGKLMKYDPANIDKYR